MIDLTAESRVARTSKPPRKTASGSSGQNPNKHTYRIDPEALISCRMKRPAPTTTASGVSVYGFRYYVPDAGRWLGRDPIMEWGGINLYGFAGNDAIGRIDILGNWSPGGSGPGACYDCHPGGEIPPRDPARDPINDFFNGTDEISRTYGPSHPWTKKMKEHEHLESVKTGIRSDINSHCYGAQNVVGITKNVSFKLNEQTLITNAKFFLRDILAGIGVMSPVYSTGSFFMEQTITSVDCSKCEAEVSFLARDKLRLGSLTRIPFTNIELADDVNEANKPFNSIRLQWNWTETVK